MSNDDAKRLILARRAKFVAAALTGVVVACGGSTDETKPQVCLEPAIDGGPKDAGSDAGPQPCLDVEAVDAGDDAEPQPCLSPLPPDAGDGG